jgi:hypothetical protein
VTGATEALTRTLALELAPIRLNAVRAGPVSSSMWTATVLDPRPSTPTSPAAARSPASPAPSWSETFDSVCQMRALNISIDHLLIDDIPRRPLHAAEHNLGDRLTALAEPSGDDLASLLHVLDALVAQNRPKPIDGGIS